MFICYSRNDRGPADRLKKHLTMVLGGDERRVRVWSDQDIAAGDDWRDEIDDAMENAAVAIVMVSVDWFNSAFIQEEEVPRLLERKRQGLLKIIPVITAECLFQNTWVGELQYLPKEGTLRQRVKEQIEYIKLFGDATTDKWGVIDAVLTEIAKEVVKALDPAAGRSDPGRGLRARKPTADAVDAPAMPRRRPVETAVPVAKRLGPTKDEPTSIRPRQIRADVTRGTRP